MFYMINSREQERFVRLFGHGENTSKNSELVSEAFKIFSQEVGVVNDLTRRRFSELGLGSLEELTIRNFCFLKQYEFNEREGVFQGV